MSRKLYLLLLLIVTCTDASSNISQMPHPLLDFNPNASLGQWFTIFRTPACVKSRSKEYPNLKTFYTLGTRDTVIMRINWGIKGYCNTIFAKEENVSPGVFVSRDTFGDVVGGKDVVVATDHKTFIVSWRCSKLSVFGDCQNPSIAVTARTPTPNLKTIADINSVLMRIWGMTVKDLRQIVHTGHCLGSTMKKLYHY